MPPECTECLLAYICGFPCIMYYSFSQSFTSHSCLSNVYTLLSVCISLYSHQQKNPLCFIAHHYGFTCCVCVRTRLHVRLYECVSVSIGMHVPQRMWSVDSICKLILSYLVEAESLDSAALHTPVSTSLFSKGVLGSQVYAWALQVLDQNQVSGFALQALLPVQPFHQSFHFPDDWSVAHFFIYLLAICLLFRNICPNHLSIFKSDYLGFLLLMLYGQDLIMYLILWWNMSINRVGSILTRKLNNCAKDFP